MPLMLYDFHFRRHSNYQYFLHIKQNNIGLTIGNLKNTTKFIFVVDEYISYENNHICNN